MVALDDSMGVDDVVGKLRVYPDHASMSSLRPLKGGSSNTSSLRSSVISPPRPSTSPGLMQSMKLIARAIGGRSRAAMDRSVCCFKRPRNAGPSAVAADSGLYAASRG
jgi:hypothetical protein